MTEQSTTNRLIDETSPYLLQHAHNPVDWLPWGKEALDKARQDDKPILLSIGYAACHWCHVMAHESFEDQATAALMNENFVNVKVDREERPDLDEIYMKAVQMMTGHGGWPMTVFLTPELKPFFGGTYFPPEDRHGLPGFKRVLTGVSAAWKEQREQVAKSASELTDYLRAFDKAEAVEGDLYWALINQALGRILGAFDRQWGGLGNAPKFPHTCSLDLSMRYLVSASGNATLKEDCQEFITTTLDKMAYGGMHDQLGGGFARYSVDRMWLIPHFEKMLYDNATLSRAYLQGSLLTGRQYWLSVASDCLDFVLRDLGTGTGAFYSSLDADSEGEEGKYYVWKPEQIIEALGQDDGKWVNEVYGVTARGNFEHGTSALHLSDSPESLCKRLDLSADQFWARLKPLNNKLLELRGKRIAPGRDEKVLTSWNSLMISSLVLGYQILQEPRYLKAAADCANFLSSNMLTEGRLLRTWARGRSKLNGYLDDYAFLIQALLDLAAADFDSCWLKFAVELNDTMLEHFEDRNSGGFFYTSDDHEELVARPKSYFDGSIPSGTSVATMNLLRLAKLTGQTRYRDIAGRVLRLYAPHFERMPDQFANMICALDIYLSDGAEIVLAGESGKDNWRDLFYTLNSYYLPNSVILLADASCSQPASTKSPLLENRNLIDGQPAIYLCQNYTCDKPITDPANLKQKLQSLCHRNS